MTRTGKNQLHLKEGVAQVVQTIFEKSGKVEASELVRRAKSPSSPAHSAFEWDNAKAGHQYRLIQARQYLIDVEIIIDGRPSKMTHIPVDVTYGPREGYYKPISVVQDSEYELELAISELLRHIEGAQRRLNELVKAAPNKVNIKKARRGLKAVREAVLV